MIQLSHVGKIYPGGTAALQDVTLHIAPGELAFLFGRSGAGKSTLLKLLLREETATEGEVWVAGQAVGALRASRVPYLRRSIGVVFQDFRLIPTLSVYENVAFALHVTGVPEVVIRARVPYVLELVELAPKADCLPCALSGGEQQRVALARALVHNPKLILADEPTGNIDPQLSWEMMELLAAINSVGVTVLVATHEQAMARRFGKRMLVLERGRLVGDSAWEEAVAL